MTVNAFAAWSGSPEEKSRGVCLGRQILSRTVIARVDVPPPSPQTLMGLRGCLDTGSFGSSQRIRLCP